MGRCMKFQKQTEPRHAGVILQSLTSLTFPEWEASGKLRKISVASEKVLEHSAKLNKVL